MLLRSVKKKLNAHVKTLARMVNSDWHDGYEEQGEECLEWVASCGVLVESALRVGVAFGCGHELGHAVLMCATALPVASTPRATAGGLRLASAVAAATPLRNSAAPYPVPRHVADTWSQIEKIPFRCDPGECISDGAWQDGSKIFLDLIGDADDDQARAAEYPCHSADALCSLAWPLLLGAAAASPAVGDEALLRMVKDAVDHGVCAPHKASEEEVELASDGMRLPTSMATGRERLAALVVGRKAEWSALPSTKKEHKQRRAIDRRFDGPKNQRTRDFSSSFYDDFW